MSRHKHASVVSVVALLICSALLSSVPARAQGRRKTASPAVSGIVPSPTNALGFAPGTERRVADWRQISNYFARLDQASPRVLVETLGQTTLRRPLIAAYISAPENIRQLNRFKEIQRKLADPRTVSDEQERERLVREGKAVVAITCSIHSTELVASQMSMQLAYELATAEDEATREILSNTILLLIPSVNPDGSDIVAEWYRRTLGTPYEGTNPPELYHHYAGHDNNRDWFMLNLRETR
ncbi:MAG: peptidase M14, partial [Acidobacteria bacterium]|nr:peptidase M14 [Acidobacteriota bacterium]